MSADRYEWMDAALCAQADPEQWTDVRTGGSSRAPKRICARCPVITQCLAHEAALHAYDGLAMHGIWGGTSQRQRLEQPAA